MADIQFKVDKQSLSKVKKNTEEAFLRKKAAAFALAQSASVQAISLFRKEQAKERFWENQTFQAFNRVFSNAFIDADGLGFFIAHGVDYGVYLELANNRRNNALRPIAKLQGIKFLRALKAVYG